MAGKTARPCDGCSHKTARWFCPADDAFLCQACDHEVHSANQLASRHARVPLAVGSSEGREFSPSWGVRKKARTPRSHRNQAKVEEEGEKRNLLPLVPKIGGEDEVEDHFGFRVPDLHQFDEDLHDFFASQGASMIDDFYEKPARDLTEFHLPSAVDLAGFSTDVESFCVDEKETLKSSPSVGDSVDERFSSVKVKDEDMADYQLDHKNQWNFIGMPEVEDEDKKVIQPKSFLLTLNYDGVMNAWASQCPPWINGARSRLSPHVVPNTGSNGVSKLEGREARVMRYKEKRRNRLFSKKIRYEVRKLNAEKRPRLKGRFVKRSSFPYLSF